jgi:hypothetical protein
MTITGLGFTYASGVPSQKKLAMMPAVHPPSRQTLDGVALRFGR